MTSLKSVRKRRQQLHMRDVRGFVAFCFCPLEEKIVIKLCFPSIVKMQTVFTTISRPDKHAELLKICFKPLVEKLTFFTLVSKSDFRLKFTKSGRKIIHHEPVHVG